MKSPERNYSPTEREALALKEALIKFQPYIEGESILAVTDHAALTWAQTFQSINQRLLTWGMVFSAYPNLKIVHRAGWVHSNIDPISRLRRRLPPENGLATDTIRFAELKPDEDEKDAMRRMYESLSENLEEKILNLTSHYVNSQDATMENHLGVDLGQVPVKTVQTYTLLIGIKDEEIAKWKSAYESDTHFSNVILAFREVESEITPKYPQYHYLEEELYFLETPMETTVSAYLNHCALL